jgi:acyl-ACP thioesterase
MAASGLALEPAGAGRRFTSTRLVRLGDVLPSGQVRLDAIARYLQDVAADDGRDAGIETNLAWLVRKTIIGVERRPRLGESIDLMTWASGSGARWAERRTTLSVRGDALVEAASLWVCVDVDTMRPSRLPERFWTVYGDAVRHRVVTSRLTHPDPPSEAPAGPSAGPPAFRRPWPLRLADLDVLGHVNNAATWTAVEDELDRLAPGAQVTNAELEYREPIDRSRQASLVSVAGEGTIHVWLTDEATVLASAVVTVSERAG